MGDTGIMRLILWQAPKGYEMALSPALMRGAALHGDQIIMRPTEDFHGPEADGGVIFGVVKREILWAHREAKVPLVYIDKGYIRSRTPWNKLNLPTWWRICWNATHPTDYMMATDYPRDRWRALDIPLMTDLRNPDGHVVILGSSQKFHHTHHLAHPTDWATDVLKQIKAIDGSRMATYRPKPSWSDAVPIEGAKFVHGDKSPVARDLAGAWCSVTYGSIACVDSILAGIPCIVLGNGVARPIASTSLVDLANPRWPYQGQLMRWAANLAYHQWTPAEIDDGTAWGHVKEQMKHALAAI